MWIDKLNGDALPWLLEEDPHNPGVRYFTLRDLLGRPVGDPDVQAAQQAIMHSKQDAHGRWRLENSLNGKMWVDIERRGKPSKWVTLRVLRVLQQVDRAGNG